MGTARETSTLMYNKNEDGRQEYVQPKMNVVMIENSDIIAQSDPDGTGGNLEPNPWG